MTATIDLDHLTAKPESIAIGVLERNRAVLRRTARVIQAAANLEWVAAEEDPEQLRGQLAPSTRLLACEATDAELVLEWIASSFTSAHLAIWGHDPKRLLELADRDERVVSVLGWPRFQSMPRTWELALLTRAVLTPGPEPIAIDHFLVGSPVIAMFRPATPTDRDHVLAEIRRLADRTGATDRASARIAEVAHELLMNATYDAPIDRAGEPRYIHDRRAPVELAELEVPLVTFATDGLLIAIQVADPFGRLTRDDVLGGIRRGARADSEPAEAVIDRTNGGAGLGLWRVYGSSAVTIVDVVPGHSTVVTAIFDVDVGPREARNLPPSLHLFDRGRLG